MQSPKQYKRIRCPECGQEQNAEVLETSPLGICFHVCELCGYIIMSSKWDVVDDPQDETNE